MQVKNLKNKASCPIFCTSCEFFHKMQKHCFILVYHKIFGVDPGPSWDNLRLLTTSTQSQAEREIKKGLINDLGNYLSFLSWPDIQYSIHMNP